jgi:1-acyl-sn-glycerol-3-phosphate acyltransferase
MRDAALVKRIQSAITDEIFYALGLQRRGVLRRAFGWIFSLPTRRFAQIMAEVDAAVGVGGPPAGCQTMLNALGVQAETSGTDNIPLTGPAIILANHPGAYDSMAIGSLIPRTDLNVIVAKTQLYQVLPHIHPHMHYASQDRSESMTALRQAVNHLKQGGILLQFGSGLIEPDPALFPLDEAVFTRWSPSIEVLMHKVPKVQVIPTIASNVLLKRFAHHPLTRLRREPMDQRRLSEFMQIIQQLLVPKSVDAKPRISFGRPFTLDELQASSAQRRIMPALLVRIKAHLTEHLQIFHQKEPSS